jgi:hypothetical protein
MMFVPHSKDNYRLPRPVTGIAFTFLYVDDVPTSQETQLWASKPVTGTDLLYLFYNTNSLQRIDTL